MQNEQKNTLPPEEIALFMEQIAMSLKAGIPLYDGMEALAESYRGSKYGERFAALYQGVTRTGSLAGALTEEAIFPAYLTGMVQVGEMSGKLDDVSQALARHYRREAQTRQSVRGAILYPSVLVLMLGIVIAVLLISVLPVFSRVFMGLGLVGTSPQAGMMRVGVSLGKGMLAVIAVLFLLLGVTLLLLRTGRREGVMRVLGSLIHPIARIRYQLSAGRLASVMSIMLVSGNSIPRALEMAGTVIADPAYCKKIQDCAAALADGAAVGDAIEQNGLFLPMHTKMIRFGARAGQLDAVMGRLVDLYSEESERSIAHLVSLIEPTLVALLSIVIGGILLTVTLPLLSVLSSLAG